MRKTILKIFFSLSIVLIATNLYAGGKNVKPIDAPVTPIPAASPSPLYLGVGIVLAKLDGCNIQPGCTYEDVTYGAMVRGGYEINQYFGIEGRFIRTFLDKGPLGGAPLQHIGIFAKPQYPATERINLYTLLGYGYTENKGNGARLHYFDHDHGFSAGIGLEYDLSDKKNDYDEKINYDREFDGYADQGKGMSLFIDYQKLLIKSNIPDMNVISAGIRYDF